MLRQCWAVLASAGLSFVVGCNCNGTGPSGGCRTNQDCESGEICDAGVCETLCDADQDCPGGEICNGKICGPGERPPPTIFAVDGDSTLVCDELHCIATGLVIEGTNLQGATFALDPDGSGSAWSLTVRDGGSESVVEVDLPDVGPGDYVLTASNQSGSADQTITLLKGEPGENFTPTADALVARINEASSNQINSVRLHIGEGATDVARGNHAHDYVELSGGTVTGNLGVTGNLTNNGENVCLEDGTNCRERGVTYIRWGRDDCPGGAEVVYDGYAAGKQHTHSGSGANRLCLTKSPSWLEYNDTNHNNALLYGMEFETNSNQIPGLTTLHDQDSLCVVCMVPGASMVLMHPGSTDCPSGWTEQYEGYLMAENYSGHHSANWVCVDKEPETRVGSGANNNGALLYATEGECGSLPCPPYVQDREITCSVCVR